MRSILVPLLLVATTAAAQEPVEHAGRISEETKVFVFELDSAGAPQDVTSHAGRLVADAVGGLGSGYRVLTPADVKAVLDLESDKKALGCEEDTACLAQLSERADADLVVAGTLGKLGSELMLSLSLIEVDGAKVRQRVSGPLGAAREHPEAVTALVRELFGVSDALAPTFQLPEGSDLSFAVLDLTAAGVSEDVATNLTQVLSAELKRVDGASVIGKDDVKAMLDLEASKQSLGCSDDTACLAEIGGALGVERIVAGHVGQIGDSYVVSLRLISTKNVAVENRVTESFRGLEEQTLNAVRHAARRLLGVGDDTPGVLALTSPHEGAEVFLDGASVGALPLRPIADLAPGRHELRVRYPGHQDLRTDVYVGPGETVSVWAELERLPDEWYQSWVFWSVAGGATAATLALAAGGVFVGYQLWEDGRTFPLEAKASLPARGIVE